MSRNDHIRRFVGAIDELMWGLNAEAFDVPLDIVSPAALDKLITDTMPTDVKPGERVFVGTLDPTGAQIVAGMKFDNGHWTVEAAARHDWDGTNSIGAKVLLRW